MQYTSDLHIEFWTHKKKFNFVKATTDILLLAGDIGAVAIKEDRSALIRFLQEVSKQFKLVIWVPGNHEYYFNGRMKPKLQHCVQYCKQIMTAIANKFDNICLLDNDSITLTINNKKYFIIGSTLWSFIPTTHMNSALSTINNYSHIYVGCDTKGRICSIRNIQNIRLITPQDTNTWYKKSIHFIKKTLNKRPKDATVILITHYKPYLPTDDTEVNFAYESDAINKVDATAIDSWVYGHTHLHDDKNVRSVHMCSNPKGYPYQRTAYMLSCTL